MTEAESSWYWMTVPEQGRRRELLAAFQADPDAAGFLAREQAALLGYGDAPQPLFARLPISYRVVPLPIRSKLLAAMFRRQDRRLRDTATPRWPIDRSIDDERRSRWGRVATAGGVTLSEPVYPGGRRAALVITHDIDSAAELDLIDVLRVAERRHDIPSSFGFVPQASWPTEHAVQRLVAEGGEVYLHDLAHDGHLPYLGADAIRAAFDGVFERSPWARPLMRGFRAGQLLTSPTLRSVVAERFDYDLSVPDTERGGPYAYAAGCTTVYPYAVGNLLTIPLTLAQDMYLRHVYGYNRSQVLRAWLDKVAYIASVGAVAVLNVHPVWVNPGREDLWQAYDAFLASVASDDRLWITTPGRLTEWLQTQRLGEAGIAVGDGPPARTGQPAPTR